MLIYLFPIPLFSPFFLPFPSPPKSSSRDCSAPSKNEALEELCCSTRALTKKVIKYGNPFLNWLGDSRKQNLGSSCLYAFCCPRENEFKRGSALRGAQTSPCCSHIWFPRSPAQPPGQHRPILQLEEGRGPPSTSPSLSLTLHSCQLSFPNQLP